MDEQAGFDRHIQYEELYHNLIEEMELMHKDNLRKLRIGFRSLIIVPTIFLALLFFTGSSKTVFLVMWIVSMFIIATYLVRIEYSDYQLQGRINRATDREGEEATSLIKESIESNRSAMHELLMREESRLPFRFLHGGVFDGTESSEYDAGDYEAEPEDSGAQLEYAGVFSDNDEAYDEAPPCGVPGSLSARANGAGFFTGSEGSISILDDDVDGIDTLLHDDGGGEYSPAPTEENRAAGKAAADTESRVTSPPARPSGAGLYGSVPLTQEVGGVISSEGLDNLGIYDIKEASEAGAEPPRAMTVDNILSEYYKSALDSDYEADFSDFFDLAEPDLSDLPEDNCGGPSKDDELLPR